MDHQNFIETITIHKGVHSSTLSPINHKLNKLIKLKCIKKKNIKSLYLIPNEYVWHLSPSAMHSLSQICFLFVSVVRNVRSNGIMASKTILSKQSNDIV